MQLVAWEGCKACQNEIFTSQTFHALCVICICDATGFLLQRNAIWLKMDKRRTSVRFSFFCLTHTTSTCVQAPRVLRVRQLVVYVCETPMLILATGTMPHDKCHKYCHVHIPHGRNATRSKSV